jgi:MFS family permease
MGAMEYAPSPLSRRALVALFPLTVLTMLPVTGVVPVLKILVGDHYGVGPLATSLFMSINMVGALLAAPLLGAWSDRAGNSRTLLVVCAVTDAVVWGLLALRPPFALLLGLRLVEGAAHIGVLTMLMATMSHASVGPRRAARMAGMGGAIIFGVAVGAPLGGVLGRVDVVLPLRLGVGIMVCVALLGAVLLPGRVGESAGAAGSSLATGRRWPGWKVVRALWVPYLFGFVDRFTVGVFIVGFVMYADHHGYDPMRTGFFMGAFMMTFTALSYPAGRLAERVGLWRLLLVGSGLYGLAYAAVAWTTGGALWGVMVACGILSALMFGPNLMLVVRGSTPETRGVAMAGFNTAGSLGFLVGPLVAGVTLQLLDPALGEAARFRVLFAATGAVEVICVTVAAWLMHRAGPTNDGGGDGDD